MNLPQVYMSRPATVVPQTAVDNEEVLSRVRESFRGTARDWDPLEQTIRYVFDRCNSNMRYIVDDTELPPGEFAAQAARDCLALNGVAASDVDLLVYGGVARDVFEPAMAVEVAARIGAKELHAMDVTCACAGLIEALHTVTGYFALHDEFQTALVCAGEVCRVHDRINYGLQSPEDVVTGVAGLTMGNAAAAFLVTRDPLPGGGARLEGLLHKTLSEHYDLCRAPVDGYFTSRSKELFALSVHVEPEVSKLLAQVGWCPADVDHYAFHQPSDAVLQRVFSDLGAKPQACIYTHAMYGNTASTAWVLALDHRLKNGGIAAGDKIVVGSAAAGFTIVAAAAVWEC